ncbi:hypothetical protein MHEI_17410 [Mycobacterium heidelbergense]|nr:hypothetical protein MHEI_17410 [Mycobacterium heidelbergense]
MVLVPSASVLADFLAARRAAGYRLWLSPNALTPLLGYLRGVGVAPVEPDPEPGGAVETLLAHYRDYWWLSGDGRLPLPRCMPI